MLKEVKMFTIVCDNCGKDVNDGTDYSGWNDVGYLEEIAFDCDFRKKDDNHYCDKCYEYDEDFEIIIKTKK
jgi:hypothetical protein